MKKVAPQVFIALAAFLIFGSLTAQAQPIQSAADGTGTQVTSPQGNSNQFDISGGTRAGANLFHSFEKFGLSRGQIANFLSNPSIRNILGRVVGGEVSRINGLVQVMGGNSNLFLMNPAGLVFGPNATLNVPASFTATTANGIQVGDYWFDALGKNNYSQLVGQPNGFAFVADQPGGIINAGTLAVPRGEQIILTGGLVINTGTLEAPEGKVIIASVPHKQLVKISQEGSLLSLGLPTTAESKLLPGMEGFTPLALPELLTGGNQPVATDVVADSGGVRLTGSDVALPTDPGTTIVAGTVDVSGPEGGTAHVLGDKVGLLGATIDASGELGGGTVLVGGDYKGQGVAPNASQSVIDGKSVIRADALTDGSGGRVIAWADETTGFYGDISAKGGTNSGDGGFVEVSGSRFLDFQGSVDTSAPNGNVGTLLLDPTDIRIVEDADADLKKSNTDNTTIDSTADNASLMFVKDEESPDFNLTEEETKISADILESATADVILAAKNDIIFDTNLSFEDIISLTANAGNNIIVNSSISGGRKLIEDKFLASPQLEFIANSQILVADEIIIRDFNNVDLAAKGDINIDGDINSLNNLTINSDNGTINISSNNLSVGDFSNGNNEDTNKSLRIINKNGNIIIGKEGQETSIFLVQDDIDILKSMIVKANEGSIQIFANASFDNIDLIAQGNITIGGGINALNNVTIDSNDGDIKIGSKDQQAIISAGGDPAFVGDIPSSANIRSPQGNIQLFGTIQVSRSSSLNIDAKSFRAEGATAPYNIAVRYADDTLGAGEAKAPNVKLIIEFSNLPENGFQPNPVIFPEEESTNPESVVSILLREGSSFPVGDFFDPNRSGSGMTEPIAILGFENTLGSEITNTAFFDTENYQVGLTDDTRTASGNDSTNSGSSNTNPGSINTSDIQNIQKISDSKTNFESSNFGSDTGNNTSGTDIEDSSSGANAENSISGADDASENSNFDQSDETQSSQTVFDEETAQEFSSEPEGGASLVEEEKIASNCQLVGGNQVKCTQPDQILAYQFTPQVDIEGKPILDIEPEQLPELLTGSDSFGFNFYEDNSNELEWQLYTDREKGHFNFTLSQAGSRSQN